MSEHVVTPPRARTGALVGSRLRSATFWLPVLVAVATVVRVATALPRDVPRYLPDEYLYPLLARSFAAGDGIAILGEPTAFPALLEPLLAAPLWATTTTAAQAVALTQLLHALLVSLAAVPVFVLARRLGLTERTALLCAALTLLAPAGFWASFLSSDALGFLLALTTVALTVHVVAAPSRRGELAAVAATGLATGARLQYVVLAPALVLAAAAAEGWSPRRTVRAFPVLSAFAALLVVGVPLAGLRLLGRYDDVREFGLSTEAARWLGMSAFLLVPAVGVALAPGGVAWIVRALHRPRDRARGAFAVVAATLLGTTLVMAAVLTEETNTDRFMERYLIVAAPLMAVAFACWLDERRPARWVAVGLAVTALVVSMRVTLSEFTQVQGIADSAVLFAQSWAERQAGAGTASLASALAIALGLVIALVLALKPRSPALVAWGFAAVTLTVIGLGALQVDRTLDAKVRGLAANGDPSWVEALAPAGATLVQTPGSDRNDAMVAVVGNRAITRAVSLGALVPASRFDGLGARARVDGNGRILVRGTPLKGSVLVALGGTAAAFANGLATYDRAFVLGRSETPLRLSLLAGGVRADGRLARAGEIWLYPSGTDACRRLSLTLSSGPRDRPVTLSFRPAGATPRTIRLGSGREAAVAWTSAATRPVRIEYRALDAGPRPPAGIDDSVATVSWQLRAAPCE